MSYVSADLSKATASADSVARLGSSADAITAPAVAEVCTQIGRVDGQGRVRRRHRMGGVLNYYYRAA